MVATRYRVGDRVRVATDVPGGSNRTPFYVRGKKGVIAYYHGLAGNPRDLSYGGDGIPELPLYGVSFHSAHLFDEDPDFLRDRVIVDVWEDWLGPVVEERPDVRPLDLEEHELTYYERRVAALQNLLVRKGVVRLDESRRLVAKLDFIKRGQRHPMVPPE